jgi:hypothetical protein
MCKKGCSTCCTIIITKGSMEGAFLHKYNKWLMRVRVCGACMRETV